MITPNDILQRLSAMVGEAFPGRKSIRIWSLGSTSGPATFVVYEGGKADVGFSCRALELRLNYTIATMVEDRRSHSDTGGPLHLRQMCGSWPCSCRGTFGSGTDAKVGEVKLESTFDCDSVTVTFQIALDRSRFRRNRAAAGLCWSCISQNGGRNLWLILAHPGSRYLLRGLGISAINRGSKGIVAILAGRR